MTSFAVAIALLAAPDPTPEQVSDQLGEFLAEAQLQEAVSHFEKVVEENPQRPAARFAYSTAGLLHAIEQLAHDQYRYGALGGTAARLPIPILRLPVPQNANPEAVSYEDVRGIFERFQERLAAVEAELAKVDTSRDFKLTINLKAIRIDLDGDGELSKNETFLSVLQAVNRRRGEQEMTVSFDAGDVPWLRGYCHFLMGFCDLVLAYDHQRLFDHCGQLVYPKPKRLEEFAAALDPIGTRSYGTLTDLIAAIHLCAFPLREPERMASAREHFLMMIKTSRESWELILAETDDDREWLPNPKQSGVLQIPVTREVIDGWHAVLEEMEAILEGEKLVPFWRDYAPGLFERQAKIPGRGRGVNLKRYFMEPADFDLVLTIQGSAVLPFVEEGALSNAETWRELRSVFRGEFFGFAVWFN